MPTAALCFSKPPAGRTAARQASARPAALQNEVRALRPVGRCYAAVVSVCGGMTFMYGGYRRTGMPGDQERLGDLWMLA